MPPRACARSSSDAPGGSSGAERHAHPLHERPAPGVRGARQAAAQGRRRRPRRRHHARRRPSTRPRRTRRASAVREATQQLFEDGATQLRPRRLPDGQPRALRLLHRRLGRCHPPPFPRRDAAGERATSTLGDAILCGATLWTDMGGGDPLVELAVQRGHERFLHHREARRRPPAGPAARPTPARAFATSLRVHRKAGRRRTRTRSWWWRRTMPRASSGSRPRSATSRINPAYLHRPARLHRGAAQHRRLDPRPHARADRVRRRPVPGLVECAGLCGARARGHRLRAGRWFEI